MTVTISYRSLFLYLASEIGLEHEIEMRSCDVILSHGALVDQHGGCVKRKRERERADGREQRLKRKGYHHVAASCECQQQRTRGEVPGTVCIDRGSETR